MAKQKSRTNKNRKNNNVKMQGSLPFPHYILMLPIIMGFLLPLIVRGYSFEVADAFWSVSLAKGNTGIDIFLHGKQVWLHWAAGIALFLLLCFKLLERKIVFPKKWMIFGGIYLLLAFVSVLFAEDVKTALFGGENLFQGFLVLASYFVLFYYTYMIFCGEKQQRIKMIYLFLRCVMVLSFVMIVIAILQISGNDPFSWEWVQKICNMDGAEIAEDKRIYLTLYNSNYVGVMTVLLLPMLCVGILLEKSRVMKAVFGVALMGMAGCLIASGSKTAMIVVIFILIAGSIIAIVKCKKYRKLASLMLVFVLIASTVVTIVNRDTVAQINKPYKRPKCRLTWITTDEDCLKINVRGKILNITWDNEEIEFVTEDGILCETVEVTEKKRNKMLNKLSTAMTSYYGEDSFAPKKLTQKPFRKIIFFKSGINYNGRNIRGYVFYINKKPYFITNEWQDGKYHYYNLSGKFVTMIKSKDVFKNKSYGFASYRGYIWSKTIPLLTETIVIGGGMDHFSLLFPNHGYASKARINKLGVIYNKPHSWYLQMGTESGVISLLCMIIMLLWVLIDGIKSVKANIFNSDISGENGLLKILLIGLGVSFIGYCLMNILYDQMIVTAPIFWMIIGAYAGISNCLKEE